MPTAIISEKDGVADRWGDDYFKAHPPKNHFLLTKKSTRAQAIKTILDAVKAAGTDGMLVFNVGHGGIADSGNALDGMVELAPGGTLKLGGANVENVFVNVFYDVNLSGPHGFSPMDNDLKFNKDTPGGKERLANWAKYQEICAAFKQEKLLRIVFLTCRVGKATEFLRKLANDWGTVIQAYKRRMQLTPQQSGRVRMHLEGDAVGSGTNIPETEENIPVSAGDTFLVGPPLPQPPPAKPTAGLWENPDGDLAHPDAPAGIGGPGFFAESGPLDADPFNDGLPHPFSPAARSLDPLDLPNYHRV